MARILRPRIEIAGTPVSLAPSSKLTIGSGNPDPSFSVLTTARHITAANLISFKIVGTLIKASGPGITVSGTSLTLDPSGKLVIEAIAEATLIAPAVLTAGG